ncbi:hypothetical protein [Leucobacter luti]|uniref:hypothetical protein n=1 Tax=Leucobacter luti TaxID=340320 RepID=UPI003D046DF8
MDQGYFPQHPEQASGQSAQPAGQSAGQAPQPARPSGVTTRATVKAVEKALDRVLAVQEPLVLAHLRRASSKRPDATPAELVRMLERRFLATVTVGGGAVGAAAAIPGVGTATSLALSGAETIGFVEASALFAHSVSEVHGISRLDPERSQSLVLAMMLGEEGVSLLKQVSGQVMGGATRGAFWGELVTSSLPRQAVGPLLDRLRASFLKRLAQTGTASVIGKAVPYGVGAVIGGTGNHLLGRGVVKSSRRAFGPAPLILPEHLQLPVDGRGGGAPRKRLLLPGRKNRAQDQDLLAEAPVHPETLLLQPGQPPVAYAPPVYAAPPAEAPPRYAPPRYAPPVYPPHQDSAA